jgi:hypothetical protein
VIKNEMKYFVVDACSFKLFFEELVAGTDGISFQSMNSILESSTILFDIQGRIRNEWIVTWYPPGVGRLAEVFRM